MPNASAPPAEDYIGNMYPQPPPLYSGMQPKVHYRMPKEPQAPITSIVHEKPVVHITTTTTGMLPLGKHSVRMTCPFCNHDITTTTSTTASNRATLWCLFIFCFCCWPCSCIPCCMSSCRDTTHECPNCKSFLGKHFA